MGTGGSKGDIVSLGARDYHIERVMGKGAFGKVHCITEQKTKKYYAMKVMSKVQILNKGDSCIKSVVRERFLLSEIQNPFIVNLWGAIQDDRNLYLILDMMIGGELVFYLKSHQKGLPENHVKFYAACILLGLECLHEKNMIHRDLKPENLLLDEKGYPHLTDFNVAIKLDAEDGLTRGFAGTRPYMAPEVFRKERYGKPVDMWGLGIVLFELLFGVLPWGMKTSEETIRWIDEFDEKGQAAGGAKESELNEMTKRILREKIKVPKNKVSPECRAFVKALVCPVAERMDVQQAKGHAWLAEVPWDDIFKGTLPAPIQPRLDRPNIDKNMALVEMMMDEEEKKEKKIKILPEQQERFAEWDWLCDEMKVELDKYQEMVASGEIKPKKQKKSKKDRSASGLKSYRSGGASE